MVRTIVKRDGRIDDFDVNKIAAAIYKAAIAAGGHDKIRAFELAKMVADKLSQKFPAGKSPTIEDIQDTVEKILIENRHAKTAKAYILYRDRRKNVRETKALIAATVGMFTDYLTETDWNVKENANIYTIFSYQSQTTDTRFGKSADFIKLAKEITGNNPITTIVEAEELGPNNTLDAVVVAPCSGNTLAKMANAITDSPVLMATKGLLRNNKPVILAVSTNDALGNNLKNIGMLINIKNVYFVPFGQDNYKRKPYSMVA